MPLVYGLSNITCEAQKEAVALAEAGRRRASTVTPRL